VIAGSRLRAQGGEGPEPTFDSYDDEPSEGTGVAARITALHSTGVPLAQMAVLFRVNAQSEVYEAALTAAGVPYVLRGGQRFFERAEVREAVQSLRAATKSPSDSETPETLPEQVTDILGARGFTAEPPSAAGAARERWESLRAIVGLAEELAGADPDADLVGFVTELAARADAQHAPQVEGVTLASMHAAKGLEWDAVFLTGLVDGTVPITHASTPEQIEEERRLLYVGITRARRYLGLSWALARAAGGRRSRKPSRFLDGLRPESTSPPRPAGKKGRLSDDPAVQRLREWRLQRSRTDAVPAYVVFDNKTIEEIALRNPSTRAQLAAVPGVGPKKLEQYADEVLETLRG
jgi:DNA helicase II / ATP-dependent DNA helicase PcrA